MTSSDDVADAVYTGVSVLTRRLRQLPASGELSPAESRALVRVVRDGPATSAELARREGVTPQSMGAVVAALVGRELLVRGHDPQDGRRVVLSASTSGRRAAAAKRTARSRQLSEALSEHFSDAELRRLERAAPLLERLAEVLR